MTRSKNQTSLMWLLLLIGVYILGMAIFVDYKFIVQSLLIWGSNLAIVILIVGPFVWLLGRKKRTVNVLPTSRLISLAALLFLVEILILFSGPHLNVFHLEWNWIGKILSFCTAILFISLWSGLSWREIGVTVPRLGAVKLSALTPQLLISTYDEIQEDGLAPQTAKHVHKVLNDGLETAVKWSMLETNVAKLVKAPKVPKKEMQVWDEAQLTQFFREFTNERYHTLFLVAATTGMRRGEVLGLKWQDIDFAKAKLSVRRSYVRGYEGYIFQEPKTSAGIRTIALPEQTIVALKKHRRWQLADRLASERYENQDLVFSKQDGGPLTPQQVEGVWYYFFRKSKLPRIRIHDLRHTHASLLLKAGVHPKVVSERLGHSSVTITLDRYSHLLPGLQEAAAAKFDELVQLAPAQSRSLHG